MQDFALLFPLLEIIGFIIILQICTFLSEAQNVPEAQNCLDSKDQYFLEVIHFNTYSRRLLAVLA